MSVEPDDPFDVGVTTDGYVPTPLDVEKAIAKTLRDLRHSVTVVSEARDDADAAEVEYDRWLSRKRIETRARFIEDGRARFTKDEVEDAIRVADDYKDEAMKLAVKKSKLDTARLYDRRLEGRLDGLRTLSSSLRSQT